MIRVVSVNTAYADVSPDVRLQANSRRTLICAWQHVSAIVNVGANVGQFARRMRIAGFTGPIHSFEPGRDAFAQLEDAAAADPYWTVHRIALGRENGRSELQIAEDSCCSSLLSVAARQVEIVPRSAYVDVEPVAVATLDGIWDSIVGCERVYLKLDVQGTELDVLRGAQEVMASIAVVEVELSLVRLYDGSPLFEEVIGFLRDRGFRLASADPGFEDARTGEMLQFDGIFVRSGCDPGSPGPSRRDALPQPPRAAPAALCP